PAGEAAGQAIGVHAVRGGSADLACPGGPGTGRQSGGAAGTAAAGRRRPRRLADRGGAGRSRPAVEARVHRPVTHDPPAAWAYGTPARSASEGTAPSLALRAVCERSVPASSAREASHVVAARPANCPCPGPRGASPARRRPTALQAGPAGPLL